MWDGRSVAGAVGAGFRWKILNYGRVMNNVRAQDAKFQALVARYQQTVLRAAEEVESAMIGYLKGKERVTYLTTSVKAAARSVQLANIQYEGGGDYTRVLDSQVFVEQDGEKMIEDLAELFLIDGVFTAYGRGSDYVYVLAEQVVAWNRF